MTFSFQVEYINRIISDFSQVPICCLQQRGWHLPHTVTIHFWSFQMSSWVSLFSYIIFYLWSDISLNYFDSSKIISVLFIQFLLRYFLGLLLLEITFTFILLSDHFHLQFFPLENVYPALQVCSLPTSSWHHFHFHPALLSLSLILFLPLKSCTLLLRYFLCLLLLGIPLFFMENVLGQYTGTSATKVCYHCSCISLGWHFLWVYKRIDIGFLRSSPAWSLALEALGEASWNYTCHHLLITTTCLLLELPLPSPLD